MELVSAGMEDEALQAKLVFVNPISLLSESSGLMIVCIR